MYEAFMLTYTVCRVVYCSSMREGISFFLSVMVENCGSMRGEIIRNIFAGLWSKVPAASTSLEESTWDLFYCGRCTFLRWEIGKLRQFFRILGNSLL